MVLQCGHSYVACESILHHQISKLPFPILCTMHTRWCCALSFVIPDSQGLALNELSLWVIQQLGFFSCANLPLSCIMVIFFFENTVLSTDGYFSLVQKHAWWKPFSVHESIVLSLTLSFTLFVSSKKTTLFTNVNYIVYKYNIICILGVLYSC